MTLNQLAASKIRDLRYKARYTAIAVAKDLGISKTAYSRLEHGKVEITLSKIEAVAAIYKIPVADMIFDIVSMYQRDPIEDLRNTGDVLQTIADRLLATISAMKKGPGNKARLCFFAVLS